MLVLTTNIKISAASAFDSSEYLCGSSADNSVLFVGISHLERTLSEYSHLMRPLSKVEIRIMAC